MNLKRFTAATVTLYVFLTLYEWLIHGVLLTPTYAQTPHIWRTLEEMNANIPLAMFLKLCFTSLAAFVFAQVFPKGGLNNGLIYGLFLGMFLSIFWASWYLYLPISAQLGWSWFANGLLEGILSGAVLGYIYKNENVGKA